MLCPDTTCSTRPAMWPRGMSVLRRKCTTNAQWTDKGAVSIWYEVIGLFRFPLSLAIACPVCEESKHTRRQSLRKVLGKFWDFSKECGTRKMQAAQQLTSGSY